MVEGWDLFNTISRFILGPASFRGKARQKVWSQSGAGHICSVEQTAP